MDNLDWNQLKAFLQTAQTGSLSAAARKLGLTQPTLSRQVAAIEQQMGVTLFERVGKAMVLTPTGLDLLEHARAMGAAAEALSLVATGSSQAVRGVVSVSATDVVATTLLPPMVKKLHDQEPGITIDVIPSNALSDLLRRIREAAEEGNAEQINPDLLGVYYLANENGHITATLLRWRLPATVSPRRCWSSPGAAGTGCRRPSRACCAGLPGRPGRWCGTSGSSGRSGSRPCCVWPASTSWRSRPPSVPASRRRCSRSTSGSPAGPGSGG